MRLPFDTAGTRALWASHFRMEKKLLRNRHNIFLFKANNKTTTNNDDERKRATQQFQAHIQLAKQFSQISHTLYTTLDSIRSKDAAFTPYIHPLYGAIEVLNGYYTDTSEVNEHLRTQWFGDKEKSKLFQNWWDLREDVKRKAQSLETFLPPNTPQLMTDDKVPLESLFELIIQCYLDCILILEQKQNLSRNASAITSPTWGKLIAAPKIIFLSLTTHGYHIGGNALDFSCNIPNLDGSGETRLKDPFKLKKIYRDDRRSALKIIKGSSLVAQRYDQLQNAQAAQDAMLPFSKPNNSALYFGQQGQAMRVGSFEPICLCRKCYYTYGFVEAPVEERDATVYLKLACVEDMWALKAWLVDARMANSSTDAKLRMDAKPRMDAKSM